MANRSDPFPLRPGPFEGGRKPGARMSAAIVRACCVEDLDALVVSDLTYAATDEEIARVARSESWIDLEAVMAVEG